MVGRALLLLSQSSSCFCVETPVGRPGFGPVESPVEFLWKGKETQIRRKKSEKNSGKNPCEKYALHETARHDKDRVRLVGIEHRACLKRLKWRVASQPVWRGSSMWCQWWCQIVHCCQAMAINRTQKRAQTQRPALACAGRAGLRIESSTTELRWQSCVRRTCFQPRC